ncbi:hypothetical protein Acy02nite_92190 [Actinoplanes cyaneus]|uniref:HEAT repeat domain-containing protein n=1 Tax=Actinoplanes cyaneus TaxID=52696 RepID=A0A919IWY8_9ACTN|nr:hypothetical protein Acy02nite_92190 [Actinoplanes cyaneus]
MDPASGRKVLDRLAASGSRPSLRLRAATVLLGVLGSADALARLALDESAPEKQRATAIDLLVHHDDEALRTYLASLATTSITPARVQAAAAVLLPAVEAKTVLIAITTRSTSPEVRVAALVKLDSIDSPAASRLFGTLLRDDRIWRLRRWLLAAGNSEILTGADAKTLAARLGDPEYGILRWVRNVVALAIQRPESVLGPPKV